MTAGTGKQHIVTFKADEALMGALEALPNRSEFIREALYAALEGVCPLCAGRGTLTLQQRRHWAAFTKAHALARCADCHETHLVCRAAGREGDPHRPPRRGGRR
jgi:hypothetical protein